MPNACPTPGLRLTPEKYEQLRGLAEAVEHGTAPFITYEADLAARAFREIERLEAALAEAERWKTTALGWLDELTIARAEAERWRRRHEALRGAVIKAEADYASRADGLDDALMILRQLLAEAGR